MPGFGVGTTVALYPAGGGCDSATAAASATSPNATVAVSATGGAAGTPSAAASGGSTEINAQITLWLHGFSTLTGQGNLFTHGGSPETGQTNLFVHGFVSQTSPANFFVHGGMSQTGQANLCIKGGVETTETSSANLFVDGVYGISTSMGLWVQTNVWNFWAAPITLAISGSAETNCVQNASLFICGTYLEQAMPLFLAGSLTDGTVNSMNLFVCGEPHERENCLNLFVCNTIQGSSNAATLYLQVDGSLVGGEAIYQDMGLFVKRPFETSIGLFVQAPGTPLTAPAAPLFVWGWNDVSASIGLVLPTPIGFLTPSVLLYINGW